MIEMKQPMLDPTDNGNLITTINTNAIMADELEYDDNDNKVRSPSSTSIEEELNKNEKVTLCSVLSFPLYRRYVFFYLILFIATYERASFFAGYSAAWFGGCKSIHKDDDCDKDYNYDRYNLLFQLATSMASLFAFLTAPIIGNLSDIFGRKIFLIIQVITYWIPYLILIFYNNMYLFMGLYTLIGINGSTQTSTPISKAYIADVLPSKQIIMGYALIYLLAGFGLLIGEVLGYMISAQFNDHFNFYIISALYLFSLIYLLLSIPETAGRNKKKKNENENEYGMEDETKTKPSYNPFIPFKNFFTNKIIMWISLTMGMITLPSMGLVDIAVVVLADIFDLNSSGTFNNIALYYILGWAAGLIIGPIVVLPILRKLFSDFKILIVALLILCAGTMLFLIVSILKYKFLIPLSSFTIGIGFLCYAPLNTLLTQYIDEKELGMAFGVVSSFQALCNVIAPFGFAVTYHTLKKQNIEILIFPLTAVMILLSLLFTIPLKAALNDRDRQNKEMKL